MEKNKKTFVALGIVFLVLLVAGTLLSMHFINVNHAGIAQKESMKTFGSWSDAYIFNSVPAMLVEDTDIGKTIDAGMGNYLIDVSNTTKKDYLAYLSLLEKVGFEKYIDNGESGIENSVFSSTYLKEDLAVTVTFLEPLEKTYISACEDLPLSEHLFYDDSYIANNKQGAKTTLSMTELFTNGACFIFQLKNGHFIISDGGEAEDLPYILDYLDELTPGNEKPVVEAWFFTHVHGDHIGPLLGFANNPAYGQRVFVEGIYFNIPGEDAIERDRAVREYVTVVQNAQVTLKTSQGTFPPFYRPQTGQKYYFDDVVVEITLAQEQVTPQTYTSDLNGSSTVCMFYIEGQKVCLVGDADRGLMQKLMRLYSQDYFTVDMMSTCHHGIDTWEPFVKYCKVKTLLYTSAINGNRIANEEVNKILLASVQESYPYGDGTKVFTFPYTMGTVKTLPLIERVHTSKEQLAEKCESYMQSYPEFYEQYLKDFYKYDEWKDELE